MSDTIYALSSGAPPAAIAVVRVSGPLALSAAEALGGIRPNPRQAKLTTLRHNDQVIDNAIVLFFRGPQSQTGDDIVEFHLHGGRAVVNALMSALSKRDGFRQAGPGEFTRRAFENGKIDLTGVEGLSDLILAETESQRRAAMILADGHLSRLIGVWQERLLLLSAEVEAMLDMSDEGEVGEELPVGWLDRATALLADLDEALARPPAERLKDGLRVVLAGPPNSGKSSLLNVLVGREAAITSPIPGTTRDVIEAPAMFGGTAFVFTDTAGLRDSEDAIEAVGVARAQERLASADLVLWMGEPSGAPAHPGLIRVRAKSDIPSSGREEGPFDTAVSAVTGEGVGSLMAILQTRAKELLPVEGEAALNSRHRQLVSDARSALTEAVQAEDPLITAESLRIALNAFDRITGRAGVENMLDRLFSTLCIGK